MKTSTRDDILTLIRAKYPLSVKQLCDHFDMSNVIIHRHLNTLLDQDLIYKTWKPPKVYYFPKDQEATSISRFSNLQEAFLEENFFGFDSVWNQLKWVKWFIAWCGSRQLNPDKEVDHYISTLWRYHRHFDKAWLIDSTTKIGDTFTDNALKKLFYLDFYSIEKYGKTKLGALMFFWKQSGDKEIIDSISELIMYKVHRLIQDYKIDAVAYIPHSLKRPIQLMPELRDRLWIKLPELELLKIFRDKIVPQKSLKRTKDRIHNAESTIFIGDIDFHSKRILVIDDAVWSWATLHETAKKIRSRWIAEEVYWLAIVGSFKGFDVISEV